MRIVAIWALCCIPQLAYADGDRYRAPLDWQTGAGLTFGVEAGYGGVASMRGPHGARTFGSGLGSSLNVEVGSFVAPGLALTVRATSLTEVVDDGSRSTVGCLGFGLWGKRPSSRWWGGYGLGVAYETRWAMSPSIVRLGIGGSMRAGHALLATRNNALGISADLTFGYPGGDLFWSLGLLLGYQRL